MSRSAIKKGRGQDSSVTRLLAYQAYQNFSTTFVLVVPVETVNHNALDYLITARFRFHDCKLRLTAKLTSCQSGRLLWVDQFDEKQAPRPWSGSRRSLLLSVWPPVGFYRWP